MRIAVQAEDGDEVSISADFLSVEQAIVTLEIENGLYGEISELDSITLTIDKARELASALLSVADAIESVRRRPPTLAGWLRKTEATIAVAAS
jgi:hypothetical protein